MKLHGVVLELTDEQLDQIAAHVADRLDEDPTTSHLVDVQEAASLLRCKPKRIYDLCYERRLEHRKDGRRTLIERSAIDRYLARTGD